MASILIIDDSSFMRRGIRRIVIAEGHQITEADNGREGLNALVTHTPDCILMDLIMPEMGGLEVLKTLQEQGSNIPVIMLTADIQKSSRQKCLNLGAAAFLTKPINEDELRSTLKKTLSTAEAAQ